MLPPLLPSSSPTRHPFAHQHTSSPFPKNTVNRDAAEVAINKSMRSSFQQAQSPLSIVRIRAYLSISSLIETCLDDTPAADAIVPAIDRHAQSIAVAATAALQERIKSPVKGERGKEKEGGAIHNNNNNNINREVTDDELVAILSVMQVSCLLSKDTRRAAIAVGALPALVSRLIPTYNNNPTCLPPAEVTCRCLDVLVAMASQDADAYQQLCTGSRDQLQCIHSICTLLKLPGASDKVKTHAARALNLMLTHIPASLTGGGGGGVMMGMHASSETPGTNTGTGNSTPTTVTSINSSSSINNNSQRQQVSATVVVQVNAATMAAQQIVGNMLGKESKSMISRKISLVSSTPEAAEEKIIQLANALSIFIGSNNYDCMVGNDDDHAKEEE